MRVATQRPKLSDPAQKTPRLPTETSSRVRCHDGLNVARLGATLRTQFPTLTLTFMKEYILKPITAPTTLTQTSTGDKRAVPPRQPLPTAVIDPLQPQLKLGLDVHLEFTMAVAQKAHASPHAPRKFTRAELVAQVQRWVAEGYQVFCVQESCGFGFVLHRELVAAGAQSFLITPIALNGKRKTDKLDARA